MIRRIFISYARGDFLNGASRLKWYLEDKITNSKVFLDKDETVLGEEWKSIIEKEISDTDIFIVILTHGSINSERVGKEVKFAIDEKIKIIPCKDKLLEIPWEKMPWGLNKFGGIDFKNRDDLRAQLKGAISRIEKKPDMPISKLVKRQIIEKLNEIERKFTQSVLQGDDNVITFYQDNFKPLLDEIYDSQDISKDQKNWIEQQSDNLVMISDEMISITSIHDKYSDSYMSIIEKLEQKIKVVNKNLIEIFSSDPKNTTEIIIKKSIYEHDANYDVSIPMEYDVNDMEIRKVEKLQQEILEGSVSQEFLYWEPQAAKRWQRLIDDSSYRVARVSRQIIDEYVNEIIDAIEKDSGEKVFDYINLGTGGGFKDYKILLSLLERLPNNQKMRYIPIDWSPSMLQGSIDYVLDKLMRHQIQKLEIVGVLSSFFKLHRFHNLINKSLVPKIYGCLGNTFGNFAEGEIVDLFLATMSNQDYLILGVDLIANRSNQELMNGYDHILVKDLLIKPILEHMPEEWRDNTIMQEIINTPLKIEVVDFPHLNRNVEKSKTVKISVIVRDKEIKHIESTKYTEQELIEYLQRKGLKVIYSVKDTTQSYLKMVLKKDN